ncbi:hypothetical protein [Methanoculleus chikugoensis]|uniref:hypothetical protein n=1 Tax=Methanoculleus chikugoensis TaxID=118126 RepID=UPI001FB5521E|nr:hypothetical protein [Methanoculleus chikugoensis]
MVLDGTLSAGRLPPDSYFQAVGSGTGAIAAWEAAERLIADAGSAPASRLSTSPRTSPFVPMVRAWEAGRRDILPAEDMPDVEASISRVYADVLTNRHPPWGGSAAGGLRRPRGLRRPGVCGRERRRPVRRETLCRDRRDRPRPGGGCRGRLALRAAEEGLVGPDERILLNVTGGGVCACGRGPRPLPGRALPPGPGRRGLRWGRAGCRPGMAFGAGGGGPCVKDVSSTGSPPSGGSIPWRASPATGRRSSAP